MMVTLTISGILLVMGVPALVDFGSRQRMNAALETLHGHLVLARHAAIHSAADVVACPGDVAAGCRGSTDWAAGWIVFSDLNGDRQRQAPEPLLRAESGLEHIAIHGSGGRRALRFVASGSAPGSNGSITFCDRRGPEAARKLVLSNAGRIRRDLAPETNPESCPAPPG